MKRFVGLVLVSILALAGCGGEESQAEKDLDKINGQITELENKIKNLKSENDQLQKNIQIKEEELQKLQEAERSGETSGEEENAEESDEKETYGEEDSEA